MIKKKSKKSKKREMRLGRLIDSCEKGKRLDLVELAHRMYDGNPVELLKDIRRLRSRGLIDRDRCEINSYSFPLTSSNT